ncbi:hypothetical protein BZG36_01165 [Bifiguratus adelaidae]|uniref:Uncharacterized protein n=1 Tax=Bifiguratus adelaidae TaxID=1938954 RepID=A0A261Y617_9FUNG|nr:hypothetical protein BZG36_01165 [Bifiguratus adelaidae]
MFTPLQTACGGYVLHLASDGLLRLNGRVFGVSGIVHQAVGGDRARWRWGTLVGFGLGTLLVRGVDFGIRGSEAQPLFQHNWRVLEYGVAGLLVGLGTKLASGCTSGHMFCGVSRLSKRSLVATMVFFSAGVATTALFSTAPGCGGRPCYTPTWPSQVTAMLLGMAIIGCKALLAVLAHMDPKLPQTKTIVALSCGMIFAIGLEISGMSTPSKTLGFLNFFHPTGWDPSLLCVVLGGLLPNMWTWMRQIRTLDHPVLDSQFYLPQSQDITASLIMGSALFGIGWGLKGICPGPGLVKLWKPIGDVDGLVWFAGVILGGLIGRV